MEYNYFSCKDSKLMWNGNPEALKSYIANELKLSGKWTSPGSDAKAFTNEKEPDITENQIVKIKWYQGKKTLTIQGDRTQEIEGKIHDEMQKYSSTGQGKSNDQVENLYSEAITEAVNEIKAQIEQLKLDTNENKASISNILALSQGSNLLSDNEFNELYYTNVAKKTKISEIRIKIVRRKMSKSLNGMNNLAHTVGTC